MPRGLKQGGICGDFYVWMWVDDSGQPTGTVTVRQRHIAQVIELESMTPDTPTLVKVAGHIPQNHRVLEFGLDQSTPHWGVAGRDWEAHGVVARGKYQFRCSLNALARSHYEVPVRCGQVETLPVKHGPWQGGKVSDTFLEAGVTVF